MRRCSLGLLKLLQMLILLLLLMMLELSLVLQTLLRRLMMASRNGEEGCLRVRHITTTVGHVVRSVGRIDVRTGEMTVGRDHHWWKSHTHGHGVEARWRKQAATLETKQEHRSAWRRAETRLGDIPNTHRLMDSGILASGSP